MQRCNLLISCDQIYYTDWAINLLKSIKYYCPNLHLHCNIINPDYKNEIEGVNYYYEEKDFNNDNSKISYLQSSRFIKVADFDIQEKFVTIDTDTICTKKFDVTELISVIDRTSILKHRKKDRWLAGFVSFTNNNFRKEFRELLFKDPIDSWLPGRDQIVLDQLANKYNYTVLDGDWMSIGKNDNSVFLTLKGEQKYTDKYLSKFKGFIV